MPDQKAALGVELRQIIQADRMASDIIQGANDMRHSIEARTEQDKARIIEQAEQKRKEVTEQVRKDQMQALEEKKKVALATYDKERAHIAQQMEQNREKWIEDIVTRITDI